MPLSPAEQKELEQLEAQYGKQAPAQAAAPQGGLTPQEQAELDHLEKTVGSQPAQPEEDGFLTKAAHVAGNLYDMKRTAGQTALKFATLGYGELPSVDVGGTHVKGQSELAQENPGSAAVGALGGSMAGGYLTGMPVADKIAKLPAYGRIGANGLQGLITGAVAKPGEGETRTGNALKTGLTALGLGTAGEAVGAVLPRITKSVGAALAGFKGRQADAYAEAPQAVEGMARALDDPSQMPGLKDQAAAAITNSRRALKQQGLENSSKLTQLLTGKHVELDPSGLHGLDPEVDAILHAQQAAQAPMGPQATQVGGTQQGLPLQRSQFGQAPRQTSTQIPVEGTQDALPLQAISHSPVEVAPQQAGAGHVQEGFPGFGNRVKFHPDAPEGALPLQTASQEAIDTSAGVRGTHVQDSLPWQGQPAPRNPAAPLDASTPVGNTHVQDSLPLFPDKGGKVRLDANDARRVKNLLQTRADFDPRVVTDPIAIAKHEAAGRASGSVRAALETLDPQVKTLNDSMSEGMRMQKSLRQGAKTPLATVSTQSPDRVADLARVDKNVKGGLTSFGDQLSAAKAISGDDGNGPMSKLAKGRGIMAALESLVSAPAGRAMVRGSHGLDQTYKNTNAQSLQAILDLLSTAGK